MKTFTRRYSFVDIIKRLSMQNPEEKLRSAFRLNLFVKKMREAGDKYGNATQRQRTRRSA